MNYLNYKYNNNDVKIQKIDAPNGNGNNMPKKVITDPTIKSLYVIICEFSENSKIE